MRILHFISKAKNAGSEKERNLIEEDSKNVD